MDTKPCIKCGHAVHDFALDDKGRCGNCVLEVKRKLAHRRERRTEDPDALWAEVRARRHALLHACDWAALPDVPDATRARWAAYRQALRDITQAPHPAGIVWPELPTAGG